MQQILTPVAALVLGVFLHAQTLPTIPAYSSIPAPLPPSLPSQNFEALPYHYAEFGNHIERLRDHVARRHLNHLLRR